MTSWIVVDSNIFLSLVIPDENTSQANTIIRFWHKNQFQLAAPTLFQYELVAVIRKQRGRGNITPDESEKALNFVLRQKFSFFISKDLHYRAFELANQFGFPTAYDSQYLAVAEHLKCEFWTIDKQIVNIVSPTFSWVKHLGDFRP